MKRKYINHFKEYEGLLFDTEAIVTFNCRKCGTEDTRKFVETSRLCHKCGPCYEDDFSVIR